MTLLLCALLHARPTAAEKPGWIMDVWTVDDGLPVAHVNDVEFTADHFVWFATFDGLVRFDGLNFRVFSAADWPQLYSSRLVDLAIGPTDGALWMLSEGGSAISRLWKGKLESWENPGGGGAEHILENAGGLWLSTQQGLYQLLEKPERRWNVEQAPTTSEASGCTNPPTVSSLPCPPVHGQHSLWRLSTAGVTYAGEQLYSTTRKARSAVLSPQGDLWLITYGNGLRRLRPMEEPVRDGKVADGPVPPEALSVYADPSGRIWARGETEQWTPTPEGPRRMQLEDAPAAIQKRVDQAYLLVERGQFLAAHEGLIRLEPGDDGAWKAHMLLDAPDMGVVRARLRDRHGLLWLGGSGGLWWSDGGQWSEHKDVSGNSIVGVRGMVEHPSGGLMLISAGQGLRWLRPDGQLQRLDPGLRTHNLRHLRMDGEYLWVATEEAGLCRVSHLRSPQPQWRCAAEAEGLPATGAHVSIDDGKGRIWLGTNRGVMVSNRADLEAWADGRQNHVHFLRLDRQAGIFSVEDNGGTDQAAYVAADGQIWFPTRKGLVAVDPADFRSPDAPVAHLDGLRWGGTPLPEGPLRLPAEPLALELRWTAPVRRLADQVRFRVRLSDGPWTETVERSSTFQSLPPGPFQIEVQAGLGDVWGPSAVVEGRRTPNLMEDRTLHSMLLLGSLVLLSGGALFWDRRRELAKRHLEELVDARTAQWRTSNREVEQQRDRLADLARRLADLDGHRTRMIVNLSHELRTPLSLVLGPLEEAADVPGLERARQNALQLQKLIDQLFDISRLEAGELPLRAQHRNLVDFVRTTGARFKDAARTAGIRLELPEAGPALWAWYDPDQLEKVLNNLIQNALKFTPAEGHIQLRCFPTDDHLKVEVEDSGPGVPVAEREQIFERLYQVDQQDQRRHGGAGVGLALARELVDLHGGTIGMSPASTGGSVFWFTVPTGSAHLGPEEVSVQQREEGSREDWEASEGAQRILVVEDHPDMRAYLCEILAEGYDVIAATDGDDALEKAKRCSPTMVLSDVMMPGMTGIELTTRLKQQWPDLPVLLLSAKAEPTDRAAGLAVADDYLGKPFSVRELKDRVARLLRRSLPPPAPLVAADRHLLARLQASAEKSLSYSNFGVVELGKSVGMSERTLRRELHRLAGLAPAAWLRVQRLTAAQKLLAAGEKKTIGEVAAAVGLSRSYFTRAYTAWTGHPPGDTAPVGSSPPPPARGPAPG